MAQASAVAAEEAMAISMPKPLVVHLPLTGCYRHFTPNDSYSLVEDTFSSLMSVLSEWGGGTPPKPLCVALRRLVETLGDMAEGSAQPKFYRSSLDPGVGKTTALMVFITKLLLSPYHEEVSALVCVSRLDEIRRLVGDMRLNPKDFAVLTSDEEANQLSSTPPSEARILFTTHAMVSSRCRSGSFTDVEAFHHKGRVRMVRVWDEAMSLGDTVSITTDQLAALREPLRRQHPTLAELVEQFI